MRPEPTPDALAQQARALFDAQVQAVDGPTATALRARRHAALAPRQGATRRWLPLGGLATAALAVALVWPDRMTDTPTRPAMPPTTTADAMPMAPDEAALAIEEALAELDDDPAFYLWLAEAPVAPDLPTDDDLGDLL